MVTVRYRREYCPAAVVGSGFQVKHDGTWTSRESIDTYENIIESHSKDVPDIHCTSRMNLHSQPILHNPYIRVIIHT